MCFHLLNIFTHQLQSLNNPEFNPGNYLFGACHTTTPPIAITAIPTSGDHFRLCRLFAVMLISPIFATLSLEKKVTVVKMVKTKPIKRRAYPSFFMIDLF